MVVFWGTRLKRPTEERTAGERISSVFGTGSRSVRVATTTESHPSKKKIVLS